MSDPAAREMMRHSLRTVDSFLAAITEESAEQLKVDQDLQQFHRAYPDGQAVSAAAALTSLILLMWADNVDMPVAGVVKMVRDRLDDGDPGTGVREPRRPTPIAGEPGVTL